MECDTSTIKKSGAQAPSRAAARRTSERINKGRATRGKGSKKVGQALPDTEAQLRQFVPLFVQHLNHHSFGREQSTKATLQGIKIKQEPGIDATAAPIASQPPKTLKVARSNSPEWDDDRLLKDFGVPTGKKRAHEDGSPAEQVPSSSANSSQLSVKKPKYTLEEAEEQDEEETEAESSDGNEQVEDRGREGEDVSMAEEQDDDESGGGSSSEEEEANNEDPYAKMLPVVRHIFHTKYQHRVLRNFYLNLAQRPWIANMRPGTLIPYAKKLSEEPEVALALPARYRKVMPHLNTIEQTAVIRMMTFERHDQYMNIARTSPFTVRTHRNMPSAVIATNLPAANLPAVFVTVALAQGSELLHGTGDDLQKSRKLYVQLLEQEFEYASAFICTMMNDDAVHCPIVRSALQLQSKRENFSPPAPRDPSGPSTESLNNFSNAKKKRKNKRAESAPSTLPHPAFKLFAEEIPIYDGRPDPAKGNQGFRPSTNGWKALASMKRYPGEIPDGSVVIPGFTISGPWRLKVNIAHPTAHFNLIFAIVLTDPVQIPQQTDGNEGAQGSGAENE
ncbi:hypothetical protein VNI00_017419 [Paramarasmius palmivorus]|uniref:Uncharacterized protein n=1 Tax=Paramarasmius palmivorus TaxID=297713 RepID=A0AAW0B977_9AGAR